MKILASDNRRWLTVVVYATAMAWVEAAVVYYLRTMVNRIVPYHQDPLPLVGRLGPAELVREAATLVMLLTVGMLAGRSWRSRLGYAAVAFGFWDIFYYVFLKMLCGWPQSLLDWDILFLLPLPWWGPVLAPVLIAVLMIFWGTLASQTDPEPAEAFRHWKPWSLNLLGIFLALYVFMADSLRVAGGGREAIRTMLPTWFNWPVFGVALALMAVPLATRYRRSSLRRIPIAKMIERWGVETGLMSRTATPPKETLASGQNRRSRSG